MSSKKPSPDFWDNVEFFGKKISGRFTIPSGIITTTVPAIKRIAKEIEEIGIITTKSIGPKREGNREPILAQYGELSFINAVGLRNPGYEEFAKELKSINLPSDKALLISIFGGSVEDFVNAAETLVNYADGFEINISCPHAKGYGQSIGEDLKTTAKICQEVKKIAKDLPVFVKLSPNLNIKESVRSLNNFVDGFTAINTVGPGVLTLDGFPILSNVRGGISGKGILPITLKCLNEIRDVTKKPVICCGGISKAKDVLECFYSGADYFGIGSALAGLSTEEVKIYFKTLVKDLKEGKNEAERILRKENLMQYREYKVVKKETFEDVCFLELDASDEKCLPGQFYFIFIPGVGEKPFSPLDTEPLRFVIAKRGTFTGYVYNKLKKGDAVYLRGPYGKGINPGHLFPKKVLCVSGGTGLAGVSLFGKHSKRSVLVAGDRNKKRLGYIKYVEDYFDDVLIATEKGDLGFKGFVTDLLSQMEKDISDFDVVFNCGPKIMLEKALEIERKSLSEEKIFVSLETITSCGIGLCGNCALPSGLRLCVDGPFLNPKDCLRRC